MSHDDDTLAHIDLSAWDAPPPPANLADAVIERMGSADAGIAVPVEGPTAPRRAWLVGAALVGVAMLVIAAWSLLRSPEQPASPSGAVVAERARSLSLPGVQAELDAGAEVRWRRDGDVLRVEQRAGTVAWRVAADRTLIIDAGAALASVEATGANLRVEVQMNAMDARVIGASALTAAAVAMVTVVVYEGHVGVNRPGQQTVVVAPGSTYRVEPVQEPPVVGGGSDEASDDGEPSEATVCDAEALKERGMQNINMGQHAAALALFEQSLACKPDPYVVQLAFMESCSSENSEKAKLYYKQLTPPQQQRFAQICIRMKVAYEDEAEDDDADSADTTCDEVSCVLTNYAGACCAKYERKSATPETLSRADITLGIREVREQISACGTKAPEGGKLVAKVQVRPAGTVALVSMPQSPSPELSACVRPLLEKVRFTRTRKGGSFSYPFVFPAAGAATCDAEALKEKGMERINLAQHAAALAQFEASLRCKHDPYVIQLAFIAACSSSNSAKAKVYYKQLAPAQQQKFAQICVRQNVDYE
jgi:hypothetical protein